MKTYSKNFLTYVHKVNDKYYVYNWQYGFIETDKLGNEEIRIVTDKDEHNKLVKRIFKYHTNEYLRY